MSGWTEERIEELKIAYAAGLSCSVIGAQMGVSRNSVIGKICRLGLGGTRGPTVEQREQMRKKRNEAAMIRERKKRLEKSGVVMMEKAPSIVAPCEMFDDALNIPYSQLRDFMEKSPNQCRFIAVEVHGHDAPACGNETPAGESWCAYHKMLVTGRNLSPEETARRIQLGTRLFHSAQIKTYGAPRDQDEAA